MSACRCKSSRNDCGSRAIRCLLPTTAYRPLPTAYGLLPTAYCLLLFQFHHRHAAATLLERGVVKLRHQRVALEKARDRLLQPARAVAVNHPHRALIGDER